LAKIRIKITDSLMGLLVLLIILLFILSVGIENFKHDIDVEVTPTTEVEIEE